MSCSAWSKVRDPAKKSNTPDAMRQLSGLRGTEGQRAESDRWGPARIGTQARAGVYVHFPWCLAKCPYCDFVSYASPAHEPHAGYADAVLRELSTRAPDAAGR